MKRLLLLPFIIGCPGVLVVETDDPKTKLLITPLCIGVVEEKDTVYQIKCRNYELTENRYTSDTEDADFNPGDVKAVLPKRAWEALLIFLTKKGIIEK